MNNLNISPSNFVAVNNFSEVSNHSFFKTKDWEAPIHFDTSTPAKVVNFFPQTPAAIVDQIRVAKEEVLQELEKILSIQPEHKNFRNTFYSIDLLQARLHSRYQALYVVNATNTNKDIRDLAKKGVDELKDFSILMLQTNKNLFLACVEANNNIAKGKTNELLTDQEKTFIEKKLMFYKREGFYLNDSDFAQVTELKLKISQLQSDFLKNIDDDTSCFWTSKENLKGLPQNA